MKARAAVLLMVIATCLLVAAGCKGNGDSGSATSAASSGASGAESVETSSLNTEEFAQKASAACRKKRNGLLERISAFIKEDPKQNESVKAIVDEVLVPKIEAEIEIIRSLGSPEGDEEEVEAILAAKESGLEKVKNLPEPESFEELEPYFEEATKLMGEYGFTSCMNL